MSIEIATWVLVAFTAILAGATIALAWATWKLVKVTESLAEHTELLANLNGELVRIEEQREKRIERERKRADIAAAKDLAEKIQNIKPDNFVGRLKGVGGFPKEAAEYIRSIANYRKYLDEHDTECFQHINYLRTVIDNVEYRRSNIGDTGPEIARRFQTLQARLYGFVIHKFRDEMES